MQPTLYWINGPWPGRLSIAARPRGGDWLDDETRAWKKAGVNTVVSTLEAEEATELELDSEERSAREAGIDFVSLPIPDRQTPGKGVEEPLRDMQRRLQEGRNVIVHCRQGIGRSAVVAAALLILAGLEPESAIQLVQQARQVPVPETEEQKEWLKRFARSAPTRQLARPRVSE